MGIRETLNENPRAVTFATAGIVGVAILFLAWQIFGSGAPAGEGNPAGVKAYYTDDDGKTTFPDAFDRLTPFDHNGKPAVLAHVFSTDGDKTRFVGYLEKLTPEMKTRRESAAQKAKPGSLALAEAGLDMVGVLYKKPKTGDTGWVPATDPRAYDIRTNIKPEGGSGPAEEVRPK